MIKWIINLVSGGLLDRALSGWQMWLTKRNERGRIAAEMYSETVRHETYAKMAAKEVLVMEQGWWVTSLIRPLFAYPLIVYMWVLVADSIYFHTGSVQRLPAFLEEWYGWIIAAYFLMRPVEKSARTISLALSTRKRKRSRRGK